MRASRPAALLNGSRIASPSLRSVGFRDDGKVG